MVRISIVGRGDASVEECDEGVNADAVKRNLIDAYGPGLLKRGNRMVVSETLSGDYEFHVKGATSAGASAGVSSCLEYISSLISSFLKDKKRGPPTIAALLLQFKNSEVLTTEDKAFSKKICESLEFQIQTGTIGDNYMEAEPKNKIIFVRGDWIVRYMNPNISDREKKLHEHLFLQKGLHEIGHILTPIIQEYLHSNKKSTPVRIGRHKSREGKVIGDAGYGLEEGLSGGRMFHIGSRSEKFECTNLVLHRLEKKVKKRVNVVYEIADSFITQRKRKFADYSPYDSQLSVVTSSKMEDYRKRAMIMYQPVEEDERQDDYTIPMRKS